jgi:toxin YoeB
MQKVVLLPKAFDELRFWAEEDKSVLIKIFELIKDIGRNPFSGIGKPEPLKHKFKGLWSRRITKEHRLIYKIGNEEIFIVSCRFHYEK